MDGQNNQEGLIATIRRYGMTDRRVLAAIRSVDRACFVPQRWQPDAYSDTALAIGSGQTISQPYTVARMIELLIQGLGSRSQGLGKVLEVRSGGGWSPARLRWIFG